LKKLQGTWNVVYMEQNGQKLVNGFVAKGRYSVVIKGNTYVFKNGTTVVVEGTFRINPKAKPKTMDCTPTSGAEKGKTQKSIYELKGDTLKECGSNAGKDRPTAFATRPGSGHILAIYQRVK
jgi:uncharacterized protein (TIGR03067 family)